MLLRTLFMPLIVVAFCVPLVHNEKTYRTLDALRSTMLTPSEILRGKILAMGAVCGGFALTAFAADVPHFLYRLYQSNSGHNELMCITSAGTLITCMMLAISTSLAAAVFLEDRNTAFVVSMITLFCFLIGNYWIVNFILYPMLDIHPRHPRGVPNLDFVLSPIMALYNQIDSIRYGGRPHYYQWTITILLNNSISAALIALAFRGYRKRMA
jgi:ABC-type transport system involved in multi-copper enzyme maturation permease subunit